MTPFARIRARFLLPWLVAGLYFSFAPGELVRSREWLQAHPDDPLPVALGSLLTSAFIVIIPAIQVRWAGLAMLDLYGGFPRRRQLLELALLGVPTLGVTMVGFYLVFAPLSLVFPDAIQAWIFGAMPPFYSTGPPYPYLANVAGFVAAVVAAPIAEEFFVRGLLLRRWDHTVGATRAVVRSSLVFAILHPNPVEAFVFAMVMCGLYAHYRSLWAPTIAHAAHNALVWCLAVLAIHGASRFELTSVAELRAAWWLPVMGLALVVPWALRLRGRCQPISNWEFTLPARPGPPARPALFPGDANTP